jgi:hypothetical protein
VFRDFVEPMMVLRDFLESAFEDWMLGGGRLMTGNTGSNHMQIARRI